VYSSPFCQYGRLGQCHYAIVNRTTVSLTASLSAFNVQRTLSACPAETGYSLDVSGEIVELSTTVRVLVVYVTACGPFFSHHASSYCSAEPQKTGSNMQVTFNDTRLEREVYGLIQCKQLEGG
jgi:hypothetical protein